MIFKRNKKKLDNFNALGLINDIALPLTPFGEKITNSDVVLLCIDRIASHIEATGLILKISVLFSFYRAISLILGINCLIFEGVDFFLCLF